MLLCEPARKVLDALRERGMRFDMPTIEFPDPVITEADAFGEGTVLVANVVVKAGVAEVAGVNRPVIVLTPRRLALDTAPACRREVTADTGVDTGSGRAAAPETTAAVRARPPSAAAAVLSGGARG